MSKTKKKNQLKMAVQKCSHSHGKPGKILKVMEISRINTYFWLSFARNESNFTVF